MDALQPDKSRKAQGAREERAETGSNIGAMDVSTIHHNEFLCRKAMVGCTKRRSRKNCERDRRQGQGICAKLYSRLV